MRPESNDERILRHRLQVLQSLPTLPGIALEAMKRVLSPAGSREDLIRVMEIDPSFTARVLKAANGYPRPGEGSITSLKEAFSLLSDTSLHGIGLSTTALELFPDHTRDYGLDLSGLWLHSLGTATWAKRLAGRIKPPVDPEEAFVSGLLHDLGKLLLCTHLSDRYREVLSYADRKRLPLYRAERDCLGCDHADVTSWILEHWRIPQLYRETAQHHHHPAPEALAGSYSLTLCWLVHAANELCYTSGMGAGGDPGPHRISSVLLKRLCLTEEILELTGKEVRQEVDEFRQRLDWTPVPLAVYLPLLSEANLALEAMRRDQEDRRWHLALRERELAGINTLGLRLQGCRSARDALRHLSETLVTSLPFREARATLDLDGGWELVSRARKNTGRESCRVWLTESSRAPEPYEVTGQGSPWLFVDLVGKRGPIGNLKVQPDPGDPLPIDKTGLLLASVAKLASEALERIQSHQEILRLAERLRGSVARLDEEKARAEQERRQKEKIFTSMPLGLILMDQHGVIQGRNPAADWMLPPSLVEGEKPFIEVFPDPALEKGRKAVVAGERFFRGETTLKGPPESSDRTLRWALVPVGERPNGGRTLLLILEDVTEERTLQSQLLESARLASVGELAAGTAHNLRSPLGAVKGILELLLEEIDKGRIECYATDTEAARPTRTVKEQIQIVLKSLDKSFSILDELLQFARSPDRPPERLSLQDLLEGTEALLGELFKERGIRIEKDIQGDALFGRKADLMQVFLNLYTNAYKAMPDGGTLRIESRPIRREPGGTPYLEIVVTDTGCGIPPEHIPRIFDPFFTTSDRVEGTGLGLSLTRKMVKEHGGTVEVSSRLGKGTSFRLTLPSYPNGQSGPPGDSA